MFPDAPAERGVKRINELCSMRLISHFSRRRDVAMTCDGGFDNAERVRAIFTNHGWGNYERGDLVAALIYNSNAQLSKKTTVSESINLSVPVVKI